MLEGQTGGPYPWREPSNVFFEVFRTVNDDHKRERLLQVLGETEGAGIVYTATIRQVGDVHHWLVSRGIDAARYHGQLRKSEQDDTQRRFLSGERRLVIATSAFETDKSDVRFVVHWAFPASVESYYQEATRAGRDGAPARATLLYRLEDKRIHSLFNGGKTPKRDDALAVLATLEQARADGRAMTIATLAEDSGLGARRTGVIVPVLESAELVERSGDEVRAVRPWGPDEVEDLAASLDARHAADRGRIESIMRYGQSTLCRTQFLREHFGAPSGEPCGHCDNCRRPVAIGPSPTVQERQPVSRLVASAVPPRSAEAAFELGEHVKHGTFGDGEVLDVDGDIVIVAFAQAGERRVRSAFLGRARG